MSKMRRVCPRGAGRLGPMNTATKTEPLWFDEMNSPVGRLRLIADDRALTGIWFEHGRAAARGASGLTVGRSPVLARTRIQLEEYFEGRRHDFELPLDPRGTDFQ